MIKQEKCLICNNMGDEVFNLKFSSDKIKKYFINYYGDKKKIKKILYKIKNSNYVVLKCNNCKFMWQKYRLNSNLQKYLYDELIDYKTSKNKSLKMYEMQKVSFKRDFDFLKNYFEDQNLNVLDYGAGWGSWLRSVKNDYHKFYGLEFSKKRLSFLKKNNISIMNVKKLLKCKNLLHFIRIEQVFEHLDNLNYTLKILKKVTKKKCILQISVPNGEILFKKNFHNHFLKKGPAQPLEHLNSFTPTSLNKLLYKHSFKKLSIYELIKIFFNDYNFKVGNLRSFLKIVFYNSNSTTLIVKKI